MDWVGNILTRCVLLGGCGEVGQVLGAWQLVTLAVGAMKLPS